MKAAKMKDESLTIQLEQSFFPPASFILPPCSSPADGVPFFDTG
jgi:hypothetical protein